MAYNKTVNGVSSEPTINRRYDTASAAWVDCEFARRVIDGAWQEVWSAVQEMYWEWVDTERDYDCDTSDGNFSITAYAGGGGYLYILTETGKTFTNPTVTFSWYGGAYTGSGYAKGGYLWVVGIDANGNETTKSLGAWGSSSDDTYGDESETLNGTFVQVGIKMSFMNCSSGGSDYMQYIDIEDVTIDGEECEIS